jgi:hypothetical protein
MSVIDRQRIAAVKALEALGHVYRDGRWRAPVNSGPAQRGTLGRS